MKKNFFSSVSTLIMVARCSLNQKSRKLEDSQCTAEEAFRIMGTAVCVCVCFPKVLHLQRVLVNTVMMDIYPIGIVV